MCKTTRATSDKPKSPHFWQLLLAFFRRLLSNGPSDQGEPITLDDNSDRASQTNDPSTRSTRSLQSVHIGSALQPVKSSSQPYTVITGSPSRDRQCFGSLVDGSFRSMSTSVGLDRETIWINMNHRTSKEQLSPIYSPESARKRYFRVSLLPSTSPTSTYVTCSPTITGSSPVTPVEPRRGWPYQEELAQSLDLSCQLTLMSPSPIFEGTYSDIYKGSYREEEVSGVFYVAQEGSTISRSQSSRYGP